MPTFPFYSPEVRDALVEIRSNHQEADPSALPAAAASSSAQATAIRGKRGGGHASSSEDERDDVVDDGQSSVSSASSMGAIDENDESAEADAHSAAAPAASAGQRQVRKGKRTKKTKNKRSKEEIVQKTGRAPSILLPLQPADATAAKSDRKALEVPNVLLPANYLRDNPNWNPSSVANALLSSWDKLHATPIPTILVVLLQSGRFAGAVFALETRHSTTTMKMIAHKTSTRYTVRKGQGGSQSAHDQGKHKAKSVGAQLRREGEKQLREDAKAAWKEWRAVGYVDRAVWVYVSCPKGMRREYLFGGEDGSGGALVDKGDGRLRNVPLDVGRPTMEATAAVLECVLSCGLRDMTDEECRGLRESNAEDAKVKEGSKEEAEAKNGEKEPVEEEETATPEAPPFTPLKEGSKEEAQAKNGEKESVEEEETATPEAPPFTPLHEAVIDGDLGRLMVLLKLLDETEENGVADTGDNAPVDYDVNTTGGPDHQTALHIASSSSHPNATSLLNALIIQGHANPCAVDARGRPPYFLASSDKHRETFRLARGTLGEDYCPWDDEAKVGPALSESDIQAKKAKALEKKRRQRARQKEKKASEKAAAEMEAAKKREEEDKKKREEEAKRVRDGLKPKTSSATNVCDFCQKVVKGKRRSQMFQRLDYAYCSTDCVKRHQRELMAAAATARLG